MRQLPQIKAAYDWFLEHYQREIGALAEKGDDAGIDRMDEKRDVLERGIFVLMFGQFENAVDQTFQQALSDRVGNPDWTRRRGWDADSLKGRRVPFETKLSMLLDRQTPAFGKILETYAIRNHCAHGGTTAPIGSIDALESDLYRWQGELRG